MTTGQFSGLWDVVSCSNKEKYICKKAAEGVQMTAAPPTTPALSCTAGWNPVPNRNVCFKVRDPALLPAFRPVRPCSLNTRLFVS